MRVAALDISNRAGIALLVGELGTVPTIQVTNTISLSKPVHDFGTYPSCYMEAASTQAASLVSWVEYWPSLDAIVVEETNLGKNRYSQKSLEFTHAYFLLQMSKSICKDVPIVYLSTSQWRTAVGLEMSKEDKKSNAKLSKAKKAVGGDVRKVDKKALGVAGKVTKKHLAVRKANELFGLTLKLKDNDIADALLLGTAYFLGAVACDGT